MRTRRPPATAPPSRLVRRPPELVALDELPQRRHRIRRLVKRVLTKNTRAPRVEGGQRFVRLGNHGPYLPDARAGEAEVAGIDVAGLDEAAGLLLAAARIRRIHEPALVVHETVEIAACPREALAEVVTADLQQLGPDGIADLQDVAEDVDQPL